MAGGSHTNFNTSAFTVGAVGGAGLIAGALGAGLANYRAKLQETSLGQLECRGSPQCS